MVGGLAGALGYAASFVVPHTIAAALALGAIFILTGAIHVDGFLDGCDAFFAAVLPQRRLEILKDPRHGTFAVAGMFVAGTIWYASLAVIAPARYPAILAFAGALARAAAVPNAFVFPYARGDAVARAFDARPAIVPLALVIGTLTVAAYVLAPAYVAMVPVAIAISLLLGRSISQRLGGGLVGDAYGFIIVVVEIVVLAIVAGAGSRGE